MAEGEIKFKANAVNEEDSELQKTKKQNRPTQAKKGGRGGNYPEQQIRANALGRRRQKVSSIKTR